MFGELLRKLRVERGLKQADIADDQGLSASYISRIESGARAVTPQVANLLAERLGVDPDVFMSSREAELACMLAEAQEALAAGNPQSAVDRFEAVLSRSNTAALPLVWMIRRGLATAYSHLGRYADWQVHQQALVDLAEAAGAPGLLVQAHLGMANCLRLGGDVVPAYSSARSGYDVAIERGVPNELRIQALVALIATEAETGRAVEAAAHAEELLALLDPAVPARLRAQARWAAASTLAGRGRYQEAYELLDEAIAELPSGEDLTTWARLRLAAVSIRQRGGHPIPDEWRTSFQDAAAVLRLTGVPVYQAQLDVVEARIAAAEGRLDEAVELCQAALSQEGVLSFRDELRCRMLLARLTTERGEPDRALVDIRQVAQRANDVGAVDLSAEAWHLAADIALAQRQAAPG